MFLSGRAVEGLCQCIYQAEGSVSRSSLQSFRCALHDFCCLDVRNKGAVARDPCINLQTTSTKHLSNDG